MKKILSACLLACALSGAAGAATIWTEGFEDTFPPPDWITNSVDQSTTYAFSGTYSARLNAAGDYLITPLLTNVQTLIFWSYTTASDPLIAVEYSAGTNGPWTEASESPFSGYTEQWNGQFVDLSLLGDTYIRFRKSGSGTLYLDDVSIEDGVAVSNQPPVLGLIGNQSLTVSNALSFPVTATDADNDLIILSASNLPPGAVFNTVTNAGSVSNTFNWASAAPVGVYTSTFYVADGATNDFETITITVTNPPPPLTGAVWSVTYNLPQQSGASYPDQFRIRNALLSRINALQNGNSAVLSTFTFSAEKGAGTIVNAINAALDRGAAVSFIADGDINIGTVYGGTNSLLSLSTRPSNPLTLAVDGSSSGIMHDKLGLFDYGGTNQWVFTASWNFTEAASANQWNIALEARSPSLYAIYSSEIAEFLAGRFHDNPAKSHAHDGSAFTLDGSWGTNFVRFAPYPDATQGGNNAERDITNLIAQAQGEIVFALNKLNRTPIRDALVAAANRGVMVRGVMPMSDTAPAGVSGAVYSYLTNSANYATTNIVQMLPAYSKADYSALDAGESDLIHAKYMVIDPNRTNAIVIHGSANWTTGALVSSNANDENTVFLRHNGIAAQFHENFQRITGTGLYARGNSTIAEWNFNDSNQTADGGISGNETQTVVRVPAPASYTYTDNALSANGWNSGADTKYWETSFSTLQHTTIKVSCRKTSTSTGPAHFKLQFKIGAGGTYTDVTNGTITVGTGWGGQLTRLPLPSSCDNQTNVFLRWLMISNTAVNGGPVGSTGASRIDDIFITGTAYDLPPVLNSIGNKKVFEGSPLSFTVTADDPIDHDEITLSATHLPTGAVFANGVFTWSNAAPVGAYAVTFYATDKDGFRSETITVTVTERPKLLISEIADPAGTGADVYRFVELYNASTNTIDLAADGWVLSKQVNGGTWYDIPLTGTVASAAAWVIANGAADFQAAYGFAPDMESGTISGNGDDAYFLYFGGDHTSGTLVEIYGEFDTDGTDTAWDYEDSRAVRNNSVLQPNSVWTAAEWTITAGATPDDMTPGEHGPVPVFQGLENQFVFLGDNLTLPVTTINTVRTDVITLSATALPAGATFPTTIGTNTVSSTLNWNSPTAGVYTATFAAAGDAGITTKPITITVSSTSRIDGKFYGWKSGTIVKLTNGQFWRNTEGSGSSIDPPLRYPDVTVTNRFGERRMMVEDVTGYKVVEPMEIVESRMTNDFSGLQRDRVYQLEDGTEWKQTSSENISSSESSVTAWRWIENNQTYLRLIAIDDRAIGTCTVEPAEAPVNAPIRSRIDGYFRGWRRGRVFALQNGQFWQQVGSGTSIETLAYPYVTITNWQQNGIWRMQVDGAVTPPRWVDVQRVDNVTKTQIDGGFYGFGRDVFFHLTNGEWWRQISSENNTFTRPYPDVLIWNEEGIDYLEMPDLGQTVQARQLTVVQEGIITNTFSGIQYGNIYQTDSAGNWLQISFDRVQTNVSTPEIMLWAENSQTNMVIRDHLEKTVGSCVVSDPEEDTDGDQISNAAEIVAGSDLFDAQSKFKVTETTRDGTGHCVLHWDAVEDRVYSIEWTPILTQSFQPLENSIVAPQNSWTDTVHTVETKGFYRIGVRLAD